MPPTGARVMSLTVSAQPLGTAFWGSGQSMFDPILMTDWPAGATSRRLCTLPLRLEVE